MESIGLFWENVFFWVGVEDFIYWYCLKIVKCGVVFDVI